MIRPSAIGMAVVLLLAASLPSGQSAERTPHAPRDAISSTPHAPREAPPTKPQSDREASADKVAQEAARLEIELSKYKDTSGEAADALVKLVDLYHAHGRVFPLIRAGQKFVALHTSDPRHKAVMLKLLDGLEAASRNKEFVAACRQFLARYPSAPESTGLEVRLADVLRGMGDRVGAAAAARAVWQRQPQTETGRLYAARAIVDFSAVTRKDDVAEAARLAGEMLAKLPKGRIARSIGWRGVQQWRRLREWAQSNTLGKELLKQDFRDAPRLLAELHQALADNCVQLSQQANAIEHLRQARAVADSPELHWQVLERMARAEAPPDQVVALASEYLKKYPTRDDRFHAQALMGQALLRSGNVEAGRKALAESLAFEPRWGQKAAAFVRSSPPDSDSLAETARVLRRAIEKNPLQATPLRYALAMQLYNDRMKDEAKTRETLRELVNLSPDDSSETAQALMWLLDNAPDDDAFHAQVASLLAARKKHVHLTVFRRALENWATAGRNRRGRRERAQYLAEELRKSNEDPAVLLWTGVGDGPRKPATFDAEAFRALAGDAAKAFFWRFYEATRPYSAATKRRQERCEAAALACKRFPKDYSLATAWLQVVSEYNVPPADAVPAVRHLLGFQPETRETGVWRGLLTVADRARDAALGQEALRWIRTAQQKFGPAWGDAASIGSALVRLGMEREGMAHWKECFTSDPRHDQARPCAEQLLQRLTGDERIGLLDDLRKADSDSRAVYNLWLAADQFKAGDLAAFEKSLAEARRLREEQPLAPWDSDSAWMAPFAWIEKCRSSEMSEPDRRRVFTAIRDLGIRVVSSAAQLALLEMAPRDGLPPIEQLLAYQRTTRMAGGNGGAWDRLLPFVQAAMTRKDYLAASTLLTGMLANIPNAETRRKNAAREMISQCYARLGSAGLVIDESSPLAPLLQAALSLRLGDETMAFNSFLDKRALFAEHYLALPGDLVLFVCERLTAAGGEENFNLAETVLRGTLVKFGDSPQMADSVKAQVQLLLARNYYAAQQYEVARSEFTTVVNRWPDSPQALDAQFGIGETLMAQRVFDQAAAVFEKLAASRDLNVVIRAEFFRGVLAFRRGDHDEAREILKAVLDRVPDVEVANRALFRLSEVYGAERRYIEQLLLLRTVGRLGRANKRFHTPGQPLSIVVYDSDLGISRGHQRIPVVVSTEPGGDRETVYLTSGGAGKGLFRVDLDTRLGAASPDSGVLEVTGGDVIRCDYPAEFKSQFRTAPLADVEIHIAADGKVELASSKIEDSRQETFTKQLQKEATNPEQADESISQGRPADQIKPGNPVYLRVEDFDRDLSNDADEVVVKLSASSGDQVQARLKETGPHTGVFEGTVRTAELPAGALASDSALDHQPLMAIDRDPKTFWQSEPDGGTPKSLTVDLRDLKRVAEVKIHSPDASKQAPLRGELQGSYDGEFFFRLASMPDAPTARPVAEKFGSMTRRVYLGKRAPTESWNEVLDLVRHSKPLEESPAEDLAWTRREDEDTREQTPYAILWHGLLVQPRDGAARIRVDGASTALVLDGCLELAPGPGARWADVWLEAGTHELTVFATSRTAKEVVGATWARADLRGPTVLLQPFRASDFDLAQPAAKKSAVREPAARLGKVAIQAKVWDCRFAPIDLRYVRFVIQEYVGEAVAINHVEVLGDKPGQVYIPTKADVLSLASNDVLEIAGGDVVTASYIDEFTPADHSQLRSARLTATYFNGQILPITYDFQRGYGGEVRTEQRELLRIEPGERFILQIVDYDEDRTNQRDTVPLRVSVNRGKPIDLVATETDNYTGVFTKEVDTAAAPEEGKLVVKAGDRITCQYVDRQNTFPGHSVPREAVVLVNQPSAAHLRIVETQLVPPPGGKGDPRVVYLPADASREIGHVALGCPLTVEVIDPDAAKNRSSSVVVSLTTSDGVNMDVTCVLSDQCRPPASRPTPGRRFVPGSQARVVPRAYAAPRTVFYGSGDPALAEGRFIGQVILQLGSKDSPQEVPLTPDMPRRLVGGPTMTDEAAKEAAESSTVRLLNLGGKDILTARYDDKRRPDGAARALEAKARLIVNGRLECKDRDYDQPVKELHVGQRMYLQVTDPDQDLSDERDRVEVEITTERGEKETIGLEETAAHSGVFSGSLLLVAAEKPIPGNLKADTPQVETYFGDTLRARYVDKVAATESGELESACELPVVIGTNGQLTAFSKLYGDEELAVETRFRIAESHFELFKGHQALKRTEEAKADLEAGRRILHEVMEDYADAKYVPRVSYLLGQFAQELGQYDEAIRSYQVILRQFADHPLAPDAQYKLAQSHEAAGNFDQALEAYVILAAEYPKSPLISSVMIRICDHFYKKEQYEISAQVAEKFLEKFPGHEHAARIAFRAGQCYSKSEDFKKAAEAFDRFVKQFPDDKLCPDALFWGGESYRSARNIPEAFHRYNRCRWDFPSSEAAKYARGRLTLPEMVRQFEVDSKSVQEKPR